MRILGCTNVQEEDLNTKSMTTINTANGVMRKMQGSPILELILHFSTHLHCDFDIFHCACAVTCTVMNFTRKFILRQSLDLRTEFTQCVLSKFWSPYHIYCWNNKCQFGSFKGNGLKDFILNSNHISIFIKEK